MGIVRRISTIEDFKNESGDWVISFNVRANTRVRTKAGALWEGINFRCKYGGRYQEKHPSYFGCTNDFASFNSFVDFCHSQYGYLKKDDRGRTWHIDKDLLVFGNKSYSESTCIFAPHKANNVFTFRKDGGLYPLGVTRCATTGKFKANIHAGGRSRAIGRFEDPMEAHHAWQKAKLELATDMAVRDPCVSSYPKLSDAILRRCEILLGDILNFRETKFL